MEATFKFYWADGGFVGAYKTHSLSNGEPTIFLNLDFIIESLAGESDKSETLKDAMLQTLTHEFCHAMQEFLGKEFSETEVEDVVGKINENWVAKDTDEGWADQQVFNIVDFLDWMDKSDANTVDELKAKVHELFYAVELWKKAEKNKP